MRYAACVRACRASTVQLLAAPTRRSRVAAVSGGHVRPGDDGVLRRSCGPCARMLITRCPPPGRPFGSADAAPIGGGDARHGSVAPHAARRGLVAGHARRARGRGADRRQRPAPAAALRHRPGPLHGRLAHGRPVGRAALRARGSRGARARPGTVRRLPAPRWCSAASPTGGVRCRCASSRPSTRSTARARSTPVRYSPEGERTLPRGEALLARGVITAGLRSGEAPA